MKHTCETCNSLFTTPGHNQWIKEVVQPFFFSRCTYDRIRRSLPGLYCCIIAFPRVDLQHVDGFSAWCRHSVYSASIYTFFCMCVVHKKQFAGYLFQLLDGFLFRSLFPSVNSTFSLSEAENGKNRQIFTVVWDIFIQRYQYK